ncbi:MAG: glycosyltransferase [Nitrospirota bacterium]|nr:glycosyltransferase [Nitrospirota bacterium]
MQRRILLITSLNKPWNNGWYYKVGLEKNGYDVICFDPASERDPVNKALSMTRELRPQFILHTKDELSAEAFQELRRVTKVVSWSPDPIITDWLPPYVAAADLFLTMSEGLVEEFRKYNAATFWLSQAFEPSFFDAGEITPTDLQTFAADVTFVGNLGSKSQYMTRRRYLERVIGEGYRFKWWGPRIPRKLSTLPLVMGKLGRSYGGKFVWGREFAKVAQLSKVFLAFDSMPHVRKSMSARMYTAVGCGAFYLCQHVEGIEEVLVPDKEIVTFHDEDEMIDKIKFYLGREDERKRIAEAGQARVLRDHVYEVRTRQMLALIAAALDKAS